MRYAFTFMMTLFSFSSFASNCDYRLTMVNACIEVLDSSQVIQQTVYVKRDHNSSNSPQCQNYRIYFSKGLANNYQRKSFSFFGASMNYNLHKNVNQSGVLKERNDALNSNEYLEGIAASRDQTYTNNFFISLPGLSSTSIRAGYYFDNVQASIYSIDGNDQEFEATDTFTLLFYVNQKLQVSIIDEGGVFNVGSTSKVLDFGYLTQNAEKGADVRVLSNGSYQLKISSQNNGNLKLPAGEFIAYSLRVNGTNVSISSSSSNPVQIGSGNSTSNAGDLYNLKVKIIENTQNKSAGMYQDVLTITAIAN